MSLATQIQNLKGPLIAALAFEKREAELAEEMGPEALQFGRLFVAPSASIKQNLVWCQNLWPETLLLPCPSITQGASSLKSLSPRWALYSYENHRRAQLIQEKLKTWALGEIKFLQDFDKKTFGAWTLLEKDWILACTKPLGVAPLGEFQFMENRQFPPTRAYLKLWETFTFHLHPPEKLAQVMDLGSCPGGWTWVLQTLGCQISSVDKAPLDKKIASLPRIQFLKKDAFALKPDEVPPLDWLFSDIICTPERLFELVQSWRASGRVKNFVCTIKFKGKTDFSMIEKFQKIPGSRVIHLLHNKHEATWLCVEKPYWR